MFCVHNFQNSFTFLVLGKFSVDLFKIFKSESIAATGQVVLLKIHVYVIKCDKISFFFACFFFSRINLSNWLLWYFILPI